MVFHRAATSRASPACREMRRDFAHPISGAQAARRGSCASSRARKRPLSSSVAESRPSSAQRTLPWGWPCQRSRRSSSAWRPLYFASLAYVVLAAAWAALCAGIVSRRDRGASSRARGRHCHGARLAAKCAAIAFSRYLRRGHGPRCTRRRRWPRDPCRARARPARNISGGIDAPTFVAEAASAPKYTSAAQRGDGHHERHHQRKY